jgi:ElaB/YqjD/DUF883 family membrane-anchored ribosome-binding protein
MPTSPPRTRRSRLLPALLAALLAGACAPPSIDQVLDTVHSWSATVRLAAEQRQRGAVSDRYAEQIHDAAEQALKDARTSIGKAAKSAADSARASAAADSLDAAVRALEGGA